MGNRNRSGPVFLAHSLKGEEWFAEFEAGTMSAKPDASDWEALAALTARLDELRSQLDTAESRSQIAAIYTFEEAIGEAEAMREQLLSRLEDRVAHGTAA
jgi:hypothetical protein